MRQWLVVSSVCAMTQLMTLVTPALAKRAEEPPPKSTGMARPAAAKSVAAKPVGKPAATVSPPTKLTKQTQPKGPCLARPVQLARSRGLEVEPAELSVTLCNGKPNVAVLDQLSMLARPRDVARPTSLELRAYRARPLAKGKVSFRSQVKYRDPAFVTERVMRLHPGLLVRVQRIANRYPGKVIEIVSGYRPDARDTSRHHHGRALDLRVAGVPRERLRDYLRTLDETGVGYYPNSYFVHMDVRDIKGYWIDRSGPGEPADYGPWPETLAGRHSVSREDILQGAFAELSQLGKPASARPVPRATTAPLVRTSSFLGSRAEPRASGARETARYDALARGPSRFDASRAAGRASERPVADARSSRPSTANKGGVREPEQEADDMSQAEVARVRAEARRALEQL
jgi:hypothetical protein